MQCTLVEGSNYFLVLSPNILRKNLVKIYVKKGFKYDRCIGTLRMHCTYIGAGMGKICNLIFFSIVGTKH